MSTTPKEPSCPPGRKPHHERVKQINDILPLGKTGAICIDNTEGHKAWYFHELTKYPSLKVLSHGPFPTSDTVYVIKVEKI